MRNRTSPDVDSLLSSAKQHLHHGRFTDAGASANAVLERLPDHEEALYVLAVSQRYAGKSEKALATLDRLLAQNPKYARGYQERGHVCRDTNERDAAITAYEQAAALNPALLAAWRNLAGLHEVRGSAERLEVCNRQIASLTNLPRNLLSVASMIYEDRLYDAERLCRAHMRKHPRDVVGMRLLAQIGSELNVLDDAEFLLESCLEFAPDFRAARYDFAQLLYKRQRFSESLEQARKCLDAEPDNPDYLLVYANAAAALGQFEEALPVYDQLIERYPGKPELRILKGHALKTFGDTGRAVEAYREAASVKPDHGNAYWSLANSKTYVFTDTEMERMRVAEADAATARVDRYQLCFALGKSYEDREQYAAAFEYYSRGNALKLEEMGYRPEGIEAEFARQKAVCTEAFFAARNAYGIASRAPIFIVGMPRAGSTLVEQILASHRDVDGTIELPDVTALAQKLAGRHNLDEEPRYPAILNSLEPQQVRQFAENYLQSTQVYRRGAPFFTDKMPNNFRHVGLIHLMFPEARVIDARREPMACCFSNFKQLFGQGHEFSYGLEEVGRYYRGYVSLMDHWERGLPGKILRFQYEDVVADTEAQVRRLLDFLGLPFDRRCLDFHETERAVHTPSADQVRQPIYRSAVEQWKHFESFLEPVQCALRPECDS